MSAVPRLTADQVAAAVKQLPSLPSVVLELMRSLDQEDAGTATLANKLAKDQALAARVLRVANSPFYGLPGEIASIRDAITVLGFRAVQSLVMTAAFTTCFTPQQGTGFDHQVFWRHSIGAALAARELARCAGRNVEAAFAIGLLHDIGYLVLATCFPEQTNQVRAYQHQHDCCAADAERDVLGLDHASIGAALAARWRFAPAMQEAIAYHHCPDDQTADSMAGIAHYSDFVAHALGLAKDENEMVPKASGVAWHRLDIGWAQFRQVLERTEAQHGRLCALIQ